MIERLEWYRVFYHVATLQQFSLAAKVLCVSQPAVSQSIHLLEEALHCRLFVRMSKGVKLTWEGRVLYETVQKTYEELEAGERKLATLCNLEMGSVCIGVVDAEAERCMIPHFKCFRDAYPKMSLEIKRMSSNRCLQALQQGQIELAVGDISWEWERNFIGFPMGEVEEIPVVGRGWLELTNHSVLPQEMLDYPILSMEKGSPQYMYWQEYFGAYRLPWKPQVTLSHQKGLIELAKENQGIAFVSRDIAQVALDENTLYELTLAYPPQARKLWIVTSTEQVLSLVARKFLEELQKER